ncbi:MAG: A24 family peptidase [Candidatus Abyssubacteria bacterium]
MIQDPSTLRVFLHIYVFALGAIVGSFLNVCIARLPEGKSLVWPGSRCPKCERDIRWYDNIPIISFILLLGRCRRCGERISWQYPAVELLTAVLFVLLLRRFPNVTAFAIYMVFTSAMMVVTFIDLNHFIIPDEISLPGIVLGLGVSLIPDGWAGGLRVSESFVDSLIGCAVGGGMLYAAALFALIFLKKEGMGMGDVKLLAMVGAFLGWKRVLVTVLVASVAGSAITGVLILARVRKRDEYIPFGTYLAPGAILSLLYGDRLVALYLAFGEWLSRLILDTVRL